MNANTLKHNGWTQNEEALLFSQVERARNEGRPLKSVFESVAANTGRKPNSIRNYYYTRIREDASLLPKTVSMAFVPFTQDEMRGLLREVLTAQANGMSVRACTLALGQGDNKAMLRCQNKYRSIIKSNPGLVREIMAELEKEGKPMFDPYAGKPRARARKRDGNLVESVSRVINELSTVEGLDVTSFFDSLGALALGAGNGAKAIRELEAMKRADSQSDIKATCARLRERVSEQEREISAQRERVSTLMGMCRRLLGVNREFLGMTGVVKMSSLSGYIKDLSRNVEDCERLLPDIK